MRSAAPARRDGAAAADGREPGVPSFDPALPRHARAVLFGDFLSPLEDIRRSVSALASLPLRGHLVEILDPAEETLPYRGRIRFEGLEAEAPSLVPRVERVREVYEERLRRPSGRRCGDRRRGRLGFFDAPHRSTARTSAAGVVAGAGATIGALHMPGILC